MKRSSSILAVFLLLSLLFSSCEKKTVYQETAIAYFDTVITVSAYAQNEREFEALAAEIFTEIERYHKLYDKYNEYDGIVNVCTLNQTAWSSPVAVEEELFSLLLFGKEMHALTNGSTNIAMGSVLSLWHEARQTKKLPDDALLRDAAAHTDICDLVLDTENFTVFFADPALCLDVGAIAKGYAAERIAENLESKGYDGILLNFGGNLAVVGDGAAWSVAIQDPRENTASPYLKTLLLSAGALVTSGSYQRYFTADGVRYHHIIHPETLYPENHYLLVSVLCADSGVADALSTALFNLSKEEGLALIEAIDKAEALWCTADGKIFTSSGFPAS